MSEEVYLRRSSFNQQVRLYHAVRPRYPEALFDALVDVTKLRPGASLFEIGPGTGQATEALARRGYRILAVELGADLAAVAREVLKAYPAVDVITGAFEEVTLPSEAFDLVYAATAFHWIQPEVKFTKPHQILKREGHLAIIHTHHVSDEEGDAFFFASQPVYRQYGFARQDEGFRLPRTADLAADDLDEGLFHPVLFQAFPLTVRYSATEHIQLLSTYSPVITMAPEARGEFLAAIADLIERQFGGSLLKLFAMTLTVGKVIG